MEWMIVSQGVKDYFTGPLGPVTIAAIAVALAFVCQLVYDLILWFRDR